MAKKKTQDDAALARLKSDLAGEELGRLYLFFGEEAYLREHYIRAIRGKIADAEESNVVVLEDKEVTAEAFGEAVESYPLFAEKKLVIVRDYDILSPDAAMKTVAEETLANLPPWLCLVFYMTTGEFGQGRTNKKVAESVQTHGLTLEFARPGEPEMVRWVIRRFAALGKECSPKTAAELVRAGGGLMVSVLPEIDKLAAFTKGKAITSEDIAKVVTPITDVVVYRITDAVAAKQPKTAILQLEILLKQGKETPLNLVSAIGRALRQLYSARLIAEKNLGMEEFMQLWRLRSRYVAQLVQNQAGRFRTEDLRRGVLLCNEAEQALFQAGAQVGNRPRLLLETLILHLCQGG